MAELKYRRILLKWVANRLRGRYGINPAQADFG